MKEVPKLPKEKWLRAFAMAVNIAIEQDYFSDLLESYLYPEVDSSDDQVWEEMWNQIDDAFQDIFNISRDECNNI